MKKNAELNKFIKNLKEEDLDKFLKHVSLVSQKDRDFFKTEKFKTNFEKLKLYLQEHEYFSTDGTYYTETEEEQIFANNAIEIFNSIEMNVKEYEEGEDEDFPTSTYIYEGVRMSVMFGQGSFYKFWLE